MNCAKWPTFPTEPAIRALYEMNPDFDTRAIDVVACGSTMNNLLNFAFSRPRDFDFEVQMVGDTLFMQRIEDPPDNKIRGIYGYGNAFLEAYTSWEPTVKGSMTSQRLVKYEFAGLRMIVRYECDGYFKDRTNKSVENDRKTSDLDDIVKGTKEVQISPRVTKPSAALKILHVGDRSIPQTATFDVKTRTSRRKIDMDENIPRLWVRQVQNFVAGYHNNGVFNNIEIIDMREKFKEWEDKNEKHVRALATTIHEMIKNLRKLPANKKFLVRRREKGSLEIRKPTGKVIPMLPYSLSAKWRGEVLEEKEDEVTDDEHDEYDDSYLNF